MLLQGVNPRSSPSLGHASIGITLDTYSHVLPSMQARGVEDFDWSPRARSEPVEQERGTM
jgi:hypothetical protein